MSATVNTGWLLNDNGNRFAPKTLMSQVIDNDGNTIQEILNTQNAINKRYYSECHSLKSEAIKYVSIDGFSLYDGIEIYVKFINGSASNQDILLSINYSHPIAITYRGSSKYLTLKEYGIYKFRFNNSMSAWELIGDVDTNNTYTLNSFGVTASYTEINYLKGTTKNVQSQINALNNSVSNNAQTNATITKTEPNEGETYLSITAPSNGIVVMSGLTTNSRNSAVWMKLNDIEVFKVMTEEDGAKTTSYKYSIKVNYGDVIKGNASKQPSLTFYPIA